MQQNPSISRHLLSNKFLRHQLKWEQLTGYQCMETIILFNTVAPPINQYCKRFLWEKKAIEICEYLHLKRSDEYNKEKISLMWYHNNFEMILLHSFTASYLNMKESTDINYWGRSVLGGTDHIYCYLGRIMFSVWINVGLFEAILRGTG